VRRLFFAVPGDLATPTGGYVYDRRMIAALRALDWKVDVLDLGEGFPFPSGGARTKALAHLAALPTDALVVVDGLALGALPEAAAQFDADRRLIALVHHPLALETGLSPAIAAKLRASETLALRFARRIIVTSDFTARLLVADYAVPADRVTVVRPGVDPVRPRQACSEALLALLAVGAVVHRKGYDVLLAALAALRDLPWRLTIVGDLNRDSAAVARLRQDVARFDLRERILIAGAVSDERLAALYASADIFVLASRFEGYGMAFAEAIAYGAPIVGTFAGAIPEAAPASAALLVPPDDAAAFSTAVRRLVENGEERRRLAAGAVAAAAALPSWEQAAQSFSRAIEDDV
jgi:glycosyltransferase involved in cell wall biosynthesis